MPTDEREQRWMLYPSTTGYVGPTIGVVTEVVLASRLAEAEAERDLQAGFCANRDATIRDASAELTRVRADLERAREALEEIDRWSRDHEISATKPATALRCCGELARTALAASSPTTRTEGRDGHIA